jgi:superfamily II RNA helicase
LNFSRRARGENPKTTQIKTLISTIKDKRNMTEFKGLTLDKFQEDSIEAVNEGKSVIVSAPTGSGKTLIADYIIDKSIQEHKKVIYTAPIKALSNQKYKDFSEDYGVEKIGLITGDVVINPEAQILIMTTEVYRNMAITKDNSLEEVSYCIMDEIHFISDEERGHVWEESIIFSPENVKFLFLSATIPNADEFADWVSSIKEVNVSIIKYHHRPVPLAIKFYDPELGITDLKEIAKRKEVDDMPNYKDVFRSRKKNFKRQRIPPPEPWPLIKNLKNKEKMPCIYFVFSRAKTQEYAVKLAQKQSFTTSSEAKQIAEIMTEEFAKSSSEISKLRSVREIRQCLSKGIAFHHAGVLPDVKHLVEKLFAKGLIKVLFATETFAVGINMPAKTVCFDSLRKFTGTGFRYLNSKEFFQISGRAGRRGIDKEGLSVSVIYRPRDEMAKIASFTDEDKLPIISQFRLSPNTVLNMVSLFTKEEREEILKKNFYTYQELKGNNDKNKVLSEIRARYDKLIKTLTKMKYIQDDKLTEIGKFTTQVFADELEISQLFFGDTKIEFDEHLILLLLGALAFEERRGQKFYKKFPSSKITKTKMLLRKHPFLRKSEWYEQMEVVSSMINPCFEGKSFMEILKNTNMLEGDIIRFLSQVLDRLEQIDKALGKTNLNERLSAMIINCKDIIKRPLEAIHVI